MNNRNLPKIAGSTRNFFYQTFLSIPARLTGKRVVALGTVFALYLTFALPVPFTEDGSVLPQSISPVTPASANSVYHNFSGGVLDFKVTAATANVISQNDNWSNVPSVEGYFGNGLTATHGIDPQTVLGTEFANNQLPNAGNQQVNANKGNPSAYNAGGVAEFDSGDYLAIGFQGNVQANPYLVFYLNTVGHSSIYFNYDLTDIDSGNNHAVSAIALQYRIGETGNFTNIPAGYVADVTDGPNIGGRLTHKSVILPAACNNQAQVQVRLIATNAADTSGASTPDEWIGINNVTASLVAPTAAHASAGGRVYSPEGRGLANATVLMYDSTGNVRYSRTNTFGYYNFEGVPVGETYIFEVRSKRYVFSHGTQVVSVVEDIKTIDFYADPTFPEPTGRPALSGKRR
jgi:hypothetical protein